MTPPPALVATLEKVASRTDDPDLAELMHATASGGFGSGFLVVHRDATGKAAFVVTNRHVVVGSDEAEVTFGDGTTYKGCEVVYTSQTDDVAVIALPEAGVRAFETGLRPALEAPVERNTVVATGYPGIAGRPSFQMTEGKVSNARFEMPEIGIDSPLVQHTAAIDPGSSGGPLTNEKGEVVGVNVLLVRSRNAAFFAVPASAVVESVRHAHRLASDRRSSAFLAKELDASCASFVAEVNSPTSSSAKLDAYISNRLVASGGLASYLHVEKTAIGPALRRRFFEEPVGAMRVAVTTRLVAGLARPDGSFSVTCGAANAGDLARADDGEAVRVPLRTGGGDVELSWRFEGGAWRIVGFVVPERLRPIEPAPAPAPAPGAKTASARKGK